MSTYSVFKYPLNPTSDRDPFGNMVVDVEMPVKRDFLTADLQGDTICVWAGVDANGAKNLQRFIVVPTGNMYDQWAYSYVGTVFAHELVFHVFRSLNS
jgi:hypothetical protein